MTRHLGQSRASRKSDTRRKPGASPYPWQEVLRGLLRWPLAIALGFWVGATLIVLSGDERLAYFLNQELRQPVFSRVSFERVNEIRTAELRKKAQQEVPDHYRLNQSVVDGIQAAFRDLHAAVKAAESYEKYQQTQGQRWALDPEAFDKLKSLTDEAGSAQFKRDVDRVAKRIVQEYMVERADVDRAVRSTASEVQIDRGGGEFVPVAREKLTYATNSEHVDRLARNLLDYGFAPEIRPVLTAIVKSVLVPGENQFNPVYAYDREYTKARIDEAGRLEAVKDSYEPGDRLVKAGTLDGEGLALLKAEHREYLKQRRVDPQLKKQWRKRRVGLCGVILLITVGLSIYTRRYQPRIVQNPTRALAFASLLLLMLLADRWILVGVGKSPMWSVTTITMTAAILTIAYTQRYAIGAAGALAMLTIVTLEAPFGVFVVLLAVASVTVLLLREIRTRLKMLEVGGITALAAACSAFVVGLAQQQDLGFILSESAFASLAALAGISIVLVLLPVIEKVFRIATSLTLLEWADTSQPLLRQLIEKAPGTWQHSHLLGSMAETAAEEIAANGLLVRVGAYYHDVGKMCKPAYFVENQQAQINAHRGLAPTMSLLVILAHVKDGLALAREHRLPPVLHQFIAEHHGTTVVRFFHAMAAQEAKASGREVSETEFRYPGPRPRSRESAILMLCDSVEGAVRSLQEPTPGRIESVVHDIVMQRLMDGQFDDSDITLKELSRIEQSLVKSLCAIHHGRIAYPKREERATPQVRSA